MMESCLSNICIHVAVVVHRPHACFIAVAIIINIYLLCPRTLVGSVSVLVLYQSFTSIQHRTESYPSPPHPLLPIFVRVFLLPSSFPTPNTLVHSFESQQREKGCSTTQHFLVVVVSLAYHTLQLTHSHIHSHTPYLLLFEFHSFSNIYPYFPL